MPSPPSVKTETAPARPVSALHPAMITLIIGAVMISFSGVWVKIAHTTPTVTAFYRVFFGGIFLLPAALWRHEMKWRGIRHWLLCMVCGIIFSLDLICYHYSIRYTGPGLGTIIVNFQVFILAGIGVLFLGEKLRRIYLLSIPLAFLGLFMIVGIQWEQLGPVYKTGIYFGFAAAVFYAGFILTLRTLQSHQAGLSIFYVLTVVSFTTAALLAIYIPVQGESFAIPDVKTFFALAALALFSQSLGWILITNALPKIRASLSGLILLLQPALAFVWDVLLFQRPTTPVNWLGVFLVLAAIYIGTAWRTGPRTEKEHHS